MDKAIPNNNSSGINLDIEENYPFQEGVISESIQRLDKMFFQKPKSLEHIIDMCCVTQISYKRIISVSV